MKGKTVELPSNRTVKIAIHYGEPFKNHGLLPPKEWKEQKRVTILELEVDEKKYCAHAMCSVKDNFCKTTGKKIAFRKLMETLPYTKIKLSKQDRKAIFATICPKFFK